MKGLFRGEGGAVFGLALPLKRVYADQVRARTLTPVDEETENAVAELLEDKPVPTRAEVRAALARRGATTIDADGEPESNTPFEEEGLQAEIAADAARHELLEQLSAGDVDLEEVFAQVDDEEDDHVIGHTHLRALLLACVGIGEIHADEILEALAIPGEEHIDVLGVDQRAELAELVAHYTPEPAPAAEASTDGEPASETEQETEAEAAPAPAAPTAKWPETHAKLDELAKKLRVKFPDPVGKKRLTVDEKIAALEQAGKTPPKQ